MPVAQQAKADIKVGSSRLVGRVRVDPGLIRSEGWADGATSGNPGNNRK